MLYSIPVDLDHFLTLPTCRRCALGRLRPIDVVNNNLQIRCSTPGCPSAVDIPLPPLRRTVIYLDTANVSHIARAAARHETGPYSRLHAALADTTLKSSVGCVTSSVVTQEAELYRDPESILAVCRELGTIHANPELRVQESQIYRAFGRFLRSEHPLREFRPPIEDAFEEDVHAWHPMLSFHTRFPIPGEWIERRRENKKVVGETLARVYGKYAEAQRSFREIEQLEIEGFCQFLITDSIYYPRLVSSRESRGIPRETAEREVHSFIFSEHVRLLPFVVINARLHAALAVAYRNRNARRPKPSDATDIEHLRAYLPYVDVFVTDTYMAGVARQGNVRLNSEYGVQVRSLGASEVEGFIEWLDQLTANSSTAALSARVYNAISAGGYLRDFAEFASRYVQGYRQRIKSPA
jgi:hypothetical protein